MLLFTTTVRYSGTLKKVNSIWCSKSICQWASHSTHTCFLRAWVAYIWFHFLQSGIVPTKGLMQFHQSTLYQWWYVIQINLVLSPVQKVLFYAGVNGVKVSVSWCGAVEDGAAGSQERQHFQFMCQAPEDIGDRSNSETAPVSTYTPKGCLPRNAPCRLKSLAHDLPHNLQVKLSLFLWIPL